MSTRSLIARPTDDGGFVGRYAHWDGYPTWRGAQLWKLQQALGVNALRKWAIREDQRGYWSCFMSPNEVAIEDAKPDKVVCKYCEGTGERKPDAFGTWGGGRCNGCSETGMAHNLEKSQGWVTGDDELISSTDDDMGTEWAYVITDDALVILERRYGSNDNDQGHGTGMFGLGASDTDAGGYWMQVATCAWEGTEPNWEAIESHECLGLNA